MNHAVYPKLLFFLNNSMNYRPFVNVQMHKGKQDVKVYS